MNKKKIVEDFVEFLKNNEVSFTFEEVGLEVGGETMEIMIEDFCKDGE